MKIVELLNSAVNFHTVINLNNKDIPHIHFLTGKCGKSFIVICEFAKGEDPIVYPLHYLDELRIFEVLTSKPNQ